MTDEGEAPRRKITPKDLERIYAIIHAVGVVQEDRERLFSEVLVDLFADYDIDPLHTFNNETFIGDELISAELTQASLVLEGLMIYDGTVPDRPAYLPRRVCVSCSKTTTLYNECMDCRLRRLLGDPEEHGF